ncbi:hypothetical protein E4M02_02530 [Brevundimonas sp. S30B]|uniref:hypothetical protein n=1 Tax=unclassified Brevundimonas TaxID=2622653 RepID=UPI00107186D5|nr:MULTISPECIES: hypothetical protein [unclassified Brevundimonas]QBX37233.1 hypothetical protein E4M01_05290 [Brevundimonas sp. MF30-B]TFW03974.1 hypothetical protein E4M02_02530 [Brevundimonas sp. S30B]
MTYFCFIESSILSVPHMEPLIAETLEEAEAEAEALLRTHSSGYAAHVILDDERVATIRKSPPRRRGGTADGAAASQSL